LSPGGSGYFTCKQNMKLVTTRFKSGGLHEKNVVATWNVGNRGISGTNMERLVLCRQFQACSTSSLRLIN